MHAPCEETIVETVRRWGRACAFGVAGLVVIGALAGPPASAAIVLDRVVAVVGAQVITLSDVRVAETFGLGAVGLGPEANADLVTTLVNRQLALSEVERYAAPDADAAQVTRRLADIQRKFANGQAFASALARTGLSEARLRDLVANDLRIVAYLEQMFGAASQPGPDDLQRYYRDHLAEFQQGGRTVTFDDAQDRVLRLFVGERRRALIVDWLDRLRRRSIVEIPVSTQAR
jgi:hypothetical protein